MKSVRLHRWTSRLMAIAAGATLLQAEGCVVDEALITQLGGVLIQTLLSSFLGAPIGF